MGILENEMNMISKWKYISNHCRFKHSNQNFQQFKIISVTFLILCLLNSPLLIFKYSFISSLFPYSLSSSLLHRLCSFTHLRYFIPVFSSSFHPILSHFPHSPSLFSSGASLSMIAAVESSLMLVSFLCKNSPLATDTVSPRSCKMTRDTRQHNVRRQTSLSVKSIMREKKMGENVKINK